jgi:Tol biopolymer transport system component
VNHIFSVNVDGSDVRQLTNQSDAFNPSWSPDGTRIAHNAFTGQGVHVFSVATDGSDVRQLTPSGPTFNVRPDWSPDGSRIAYGSDRDGTWELWTMGADGRDPLRLTSGGAPTTCASSCFLLQVSPSWAPDGSAIAYVSTAPGEGVAIVAPDGSGKRLVPGTAGTRSARWQSGVSLSVKASRVRIPSTRPGTAVGARVTVANAGRRDATRVQVRIAVTSGRGRMRATARGATCSSARVIVCSVARLPGGGTLPIQLRVTPTAVGRLAMRVSVDAAEADVDPGNDIAQLAVTARRR